MKIALPFFLEVARFLMITKTMGAGAPSPSPRQSTVKVNAVLARLINHRIYMHKQQ